MCRDWQGGSNANEWQYTPDTVVFVNLIVLPTTVAAKTTVTCLQKKTDYAFFHYAIFSGEETDWDGYSHRVIKVYIPNKQVSWRLSVFRISFYPRNSLIFLLILVIEDYYWI